MKAHILTILLLLFTTQVHSVCFGVPLKVFGALNFNCRSLCCADGFVQSLGSGIDCVSCDSVGLVACAKCALYSFSQSGNNYTYKCLSSKNIPGVVTVGDISVCSNSGVIDNLYALNNYTNLNSCSLCSALIPNSRTCGYQNTCNLSLPGNTGNGCRHRLKALSCSDGYVFGNLEKSTCESCSYHMYGCTNCSRNNACFTCDSALNLTVSENKTGCVCIPQTQCMVCTGKYQTYNATSAACECIAGYSNISDICVKTPLCGQNQIYNPTNSSCQCKIGFVLNTQTQECQLLVCGSHSTLSGTGACECDNGYDYIGNACVALGSYDARSWMYNVQLTVQNASFTISSSYDCGCPKNFTYFNGSCIQCSFLDLNCPCSSGYAYVNSTCKSCQELGRTNCFQCFPKIKNGTVNYDWCNRCVPGSYHNPNVYHPQETAVCTECAELSNDECTSCVNPRFHPFNFYCVGCIISDAMLGRYGTCDPCSRKIPHCINCFYLRDIPFTQTCYTCEYPYVLSNNSCVCPSPLNNGSCLPCDVGCMQCSEDVCLKCLPGMVLQNDRCQCISNSLTIDNFCEDCKSNLKGRNIQGCITCATADTCLQCNQGYALYLDNCQMCSRFMVGCLACTDNSTCTSCNTTMGYKLVEGQCVCDNGFTFVGGKCRNCTQMMHGCIACTDYQTCTACNLTGSFHLEADHTCKCNLGYIQQNQICYNCDQKIHGCILCNSSTTCAACKVGYHLTDDKKCECASGFTKKDEDCLPCPQAIPNCVSCSPNNCQQCSYSFKLNGNKTACVFDHCQTLCAECNHTNAACYSCVPHSYLTILGRCKCQLYRYQNSTTNSCELCNKTIPYCAKCWNSLYCQQCEPGLVMIDDETCGCLDGMYIVKVSQHSYYCAPCPANCLTCSANNTCTSCNQNLNRELVEGYCQCKSGYTPSYPDPDHPWRDSSFCSPTEVEQEPQQQPQPEPQPEPQPQPQPEDP